MQDRTPLSANNDHCNYGGRLPSGDSDFGELIENAPRTARIEGMYANTGAQSHHDRAALDRLLR